MTKPPSEVSATFQGGLRGDVSGTIPLGIGPIQPRVVPPEPPPPSPPPGVMHHLGNPDLWRIVGEAVRELLGLIMRDRLSARAER